MVTDFTAGTDILLFSHDVFANVRDVLRHAASSGGNTTITLCDTQTVSLLGITDLAKLSNDIKFF